MENCEERRVDTGPTEVDLIIQHGVVVPMTDDDCVLYDGSLAVDKGRITAVGPASEISRRYTGRDVLDARGKAVLPGLINAHHHFLQTFLKGSRDDLPFTAWIDKVSAPLISMAVSDYLAGDPELQCQAARLGCAEALLSGITCVLNMEWATPPELIGVYEEMGIRAVHTLSMSDVDRWGNAGMLLPTEGVLELADELIARCESLPHGRVSFRYGPACENSVSADLLREVRERATHRGVGIHMHAAESQLSQKTIHEQFGLTPVQYLRDLGLLGPDVLAAHCIWLADGDVEILAETGTGVSYSPECHMKVALGVAPIVKMLEAGVNVGLGIDSDAVNDNVDLFEAARVGAMLQKVETMDPSVIPAAEALEMATIGGARALGMDDDIGSLEPGKQADVILVDLSGAHMRPINSIVNNLVYAASAPADISDVIVDGEVLVRDHELCRFDERVIVTESESYLLERLSGAGMEVPPFYRS